MYHTLDICQDVAQKLNQPNHTITVVEEAIANRKYYSNDWQRDSIAYGFAGIATFYAVMDASFPEENYDHLAHDYLQLSVESLEENEFSTHSLFHGITGLCVTALLCSKQGIRYKTLTEKLDNILIQFMQYELFKSLSFEGPIPPDRYNLTDGLAGILNYISMRKDNPLLRSVGFSSIKNLSLAFRKKSHTLSHPLPGWFVDSDSYITSEQKQKYAKGCFLLDAQYGISGLLSSLAIAALEGFCPDEGYELMQEIANWLRNKQGKYSSGIFWKHTLDLQEEISAHISAPETNRDAWCYGIPAVSRALFLSAKVLKDKSLQAFAEEAFISMWDKSEKEWNQLGTSFSYGRAGHLAITYRMAQETGSNFLKNKLPELEEGLKKFYNPNFPFGFQAVGFSDKGDYMWIDDPGLYSGAAGIALSLLMLHKEPTNSWDRLFANT